MFQFVYELLPKIGYHHPIHPTEVHMPIGLVVGALAMQIAGLILRRQALSMAARYCMILALIWLFPTILFGVMDWQQYYKGAWLFAIKMKFILGVALAPMLFVAVLVSKHREASKRTLLVYSLCFLTVVWIGYWGGELVLGGRSPVVPEAFQQAGDIFERRCALCHLGGANFENPSTSIRESTQMSSFDTFNSHLRSPKRGDGTPGDMPAFSVAELPDEIVWQLYQYIVHILGCPPAVLEYRGRVPVGSRTEADAGAALKGQGSRSR